MRRTRWHRTVMVSLAAYLAGKEHFESGNIMKGLMYSLITAGLTIVGIKLFDYFWPHLGYFKPFNMQYTKEGLQPPYTKELKKIDLGPSYIYLRLGPRIGMEFSDFSLRFVEKYYAWELLKKGRLWGWKQAPEAKVSIERVEEQSSLKEPLGTRRNSRKDEKGGFIFYLEEPALKTRGEFLWFKAKIEAKKEWKGWIQFESNVGKISRGGVQLPIEAIEQKQGGAML